MVRFLLLTSILLLSMSSFAQKIRFCDTSNEWVYVRQYEVNPGHHVKHESIRQYFSGDTVVNGVVYYKLSTRRANTQFISEVLVREDTVAHKVYSLTLDAQNNVKEMLYLNFDLHLNDTVTDGYDRYAVLSNDSTLVDSIYHRVFYISGHGVYQVIENIHNYRLLQMGNTVSLACFFNKGLRPFIDTMYQNNQNDCSDTALSVYNVLPGTPIRITVYPQPAYGYANIELTPAIRSGELVIINAMGQLVFKKAIQNENFFIINNNFPQGLYFYRFTDNTSNNIYSGRLIFAH